MQEQTNKKPIIIINSRRLGNPTGPPAWARESRSGSAAEALGGNPPPHPLLDSLSSRFQETMVVSPGLRSTENRTLWPPPTGGSSSSFGGAAAAKDEAETEERDKEALTWAPFWSSMVGGDPNAKKMRDF